MSRCRLLLAVVVAAVVATGPLRPAAAAPTITLKGKGGTWALPLVDKLQKDASNATPPALGEYTQAGSGPGRQEVASGKPETGQTLASDFAVSEIPIQSDDKGAATKAKRTLVQVPYAGGSLAFVFNVGSFSGELTSLHLSVRTLAKIFTGKIRFWNDDDITAENGCKAIPGDFLFARIAPVVPSEDEALISVLTGLFLKFAPDIWQPYALSKGVSVDQPLSVWPPDLFVDSVQGGEKAVMAKVWPINPITNEKVAINMAIGVVAPGWAAAFKAPLVSVKNAAGQYVTPTDDAQSRAVSTGTIDATTGEVAFPDLVGDQSKDPTPCPSTRSVAKVTAPTAQPQAPAATLSTAAAGAKARSVAAVDPAAYPIPMMSYLIAPSVGLPADRAAALAAFVRFLYSDTAKTDATTLHYVPPNAAMAALGTKLADTLAPSVVTPPGNTPPASGSGTPSAAPGGGTPANGGTGGTTGTPSGGTAGTTGNGSPTGSSGTSGNGAQLPNTGGGPQRQELAVGGALVAMGELGRRRLRARRR